MSAPGVLPEHTWIDYFRVVRRLGRGGFGVTYLAEEYREWEAGSEGHTPLRMVAIKEYFPRGLASRPDGQTVAVSQDVEGSEQAFNMALKGFYNEAESLMRFDHPNVIKIYRVFQRNGTAYYVMPFLKGESLKSILKREGAIGEARTRAMLLPVLDGLIHAHARGILHRDIKPDNVMIPDEGGPVLIDFGAARAQAVDEVGDYTRHSELVAYTPGYAALEQYGRATRDNPHGPQTDVYGLAAVMYHCVVGEAPPEASLRSMRLSNGDEDPIVPASVRLMDTPGFTRAFLAAIDWGLELASRNRPATLKEFRSALDGALEPPALTQARLERHGVSIEPYTRPVAFPTTLNPAGGQTTTRRTIHSLGSQASSDGAPLTTPTTGARPTSLSRPSQPRAVESATDTIFYSGAPVTRSPGATQRLEDATLVADPAARGQPSLMVEARPPRTPARPAPAQGREDSGAGKRLLPVVALVVALAAIGFVSREQIAGLFGGDTTPTTPAPASSPVVAAAPAIAPAVETPPAAPPAPAPVDDTRAKAENEAFEAAKQADSLKAWNAFMRAFPDSPLKAAAEVRIAALQSEPDAKRDTPSDTKSGAKAGSVDQTRSEAELKAALAAETQREPNAVTVVPPASAPAPAAGAAEPPPAAAPAVEAAPVAAPVAAKMLPGGFRDCPVCPEMVRVPGGSFEMGDSLGEGEADEVPVHSVRIAALNVGRYEVTYDEWAACAAAGGCSPKSEDAGKGRRPVVKLSWDDAQSYIAWITKETGKPYRLPSEAELEYLNRAGTTTSYPWGSDAGSACSRANVADAQAKARNPDWATFACDDGYRGTAPVGSFPANAFGLFDVAGNVWEWAQDCYRPYTQASGDGKAHSPAGCDRRVLRGGSWSEGPRNMRSADRSWSAPSARLNVLGFRVVRGE